MAAHVRLCGLAAILLLGSCSAPSRFDLSTVRDLEGSGLDAKGRALLEKKVLCPECGTIMKMEKNTEPGAITTIRPRVVGKTDPPPKIDPDAWSMSDFS